MILSAGILFVHNEEVLLAHSTNSSWMKTWMPPKGHVEDGESIIDSAIRETEEEIGVRVSAALLNKSIDVDYTDKKGKVYKRVSVFPVYLISKDFDSNPGIQRVGDLQKEEVDQIQWMDINEAERRALPRYIDCIRKAIKQ
jgi:8-oxo-dGTP pyrophosphatase MutT (NUDIX family)